MTMPIDHAKSACDEQRLHAYLDQELSADEEAALEAHLDQCPRCREHLRDGAAEQHWWDAAGSYLKSDDLDEVGDSDSIRSWRASTAQADMSHQVVLRQIREWLDPADDPKYIGRFGGYEILGVVGCGGMGVVLKGFEPSLNRYVAIKVLSPVLATSGAARQRFAREAQAAAAVLHENVIAIHRVDESHGLPYLVMPLVSGISLQKRIDDEGPLPVTAILRIGRQIAAGLAAAHAQGLVHRDIKPANILLDRGVERVTITDFGLARAADDGSLTRTGVIAGTPQFMSPEQSRGESVDARSDLFSLGSVLYAMCTGRPPFRAETGYATLRRVTDDQPRSVREINPEIPPWLCKLIDKLMAKQAADRYQFAGEVAELLEACLAHMQQPTVAKLPASLHPASSSRFSFLSRRKLGVLVLIATLGLGLLGLFAWQATNAPDIAGNWSGEEWGQVVLKKTSDGEYSGTYTDTIKESPGTIDVKWSRPERRYKGQWREGQNRSGKISLRLVDDEIHGAWTTSKTSEINPGTPELADLTWRRSSDTLRSSPAAAPAAKIQVKFAAPQGMEISVADKQGQFGKSRSFVAPVRLNLVAGKTHRLKLARIAGREGAEFYPTIGIASADLRTRTFLAHNAIPIEFTDEDFEQALAGNLLVKVIYLPDSESQDARIGDVETLVSSRLDPGKNPIAEAGRRGSILTVIRLGNKDVELSGNEQEASEPPPRYEHEANQETELRPQALSAAVKQFNAQTAELRRELFDPPIEDLTVERLREGFRQTAELYRRHGKKEIADVLLQIADSGQLPKGASGLIASGVHAQDETGRTISRQIVPGFTLPDPSHAGRVELILLRPLELLYRKDGAASKDYGDRLVHEDAASSAMSPAAAFNDQRR